MVQADLRVVANPLINITLQGREDTYPERWGMTRATERSIDWLTKPVAKVKACENTLMNSPSRPSGIQ
jgi:hypothetical protein